MEQSLQRLDAAQRVQLWAERIGECRSSGMICESAAVVQLISGEG